LFGERIHASGRFRPAAIRSNLRTASFRHSATEIGAEGLAAIATSTASAATLAGLSFHGLDGIAATSRGLLPDAQKGFAFVVYTCSARSSPWHTGW
jgi:hypothetical protein